jgi:hypothetical protein
MLLHIDGSQHRWFCDERWYDLLVIMATLPARSTTRDWWKKNRRRTVMLALREVIEQKGLFFALYRSLPEAFERDKSVGQDLLIARLVLIDKDHGMGFPS